MRPDQGDSDSAGPRAAPSATAVREGACGYWDRRGLPTEPAQVAVAPGGPLLLLAVLAAAAGAGTGTGGGAGERGTGGVLLPHPCPPWYAEQARLLGRAVHTVPVPVECGGIPDPFALLEAVRRTRAAGEVPQALVLSVADDVTGTAPPPELLHEVCEAAVAEGLLIVSDETWRDTSHDPHDTVVVSPAEMLTEAGRADHVVVLAGLEAAFESTFGTGAGAAPRRPGPPPAIARVPATGRGRLLGERVHEVLAALRADLPGPAAEAAAEALREPAELLSRRAEAARLHGGLARALHQAVTGAGALCRPPHLGRHLYADLDPFRPRLARRGITDAAGLEAELVRRLGPYALGGHRFGDDPHELRVRLTTELPAAALPAADRAADRPVGTGGSGATARPEPGELPGAAETLAQVQSVLVDLTDGSPQ
ncbi:aminotransferase class I/II-fold pyridoxal phosphate-dependent enzyme [Streptomyces sp. A73]|uniref:aminotransferase class I/II-fold pyridoxal phosphate-dependent enzyme n=1 Tax=Streptomyces TaxID=1883 RepID=UPI000C1748A2|nr:MULTISPECIES: aminotransferase class I/II-fold pyridoxal phosphate-dependent enzyme [unclassified Streptomyces]MBQ0863915.1 aminotransferase class I/II-fold pyridoxal phosphate-dependent enzyme [Streptomyces sp. RK75]MBQ1120316.1 aminotransferase class I/II-fold pyridoxal phosphate-dependent enzyme [Streptomyces sp. B15]MBQ1157913.1 aminotransferase class I/II-fold pyridoxal phosphate-dependent enzyme [Streptomyces sp. A73]